MGSVREIAVDGLRSLAWWGDDLMDWLGGKRITLRGDVQRFGVGGTWKFDAAIGSGEVGITFETNGTKGRIARWNGRLPEGNIVPAGIDQLREIDRSYSHADSHVSRLCVHGP